jgi:hypothetical protein
VTLAYEFNPRHAKVKQNHTPITIKLIATTNEQMEGLLSMFLQQVDPDRVIATLKSGPTKVIWVHTVAKSIALHGLTSSRGHGAMTIWVAHRICG